MLITGVKKQFRVLGRRDEWFQTGWTGSVRRRPETDRSGSQSVRAVRLRGEDIGDHPPGPAHPGDRGLRGVAEFLRHSSRAAARTQLANRVHDLGAHLCGRRQVGRL
jgi:hypothetical protein